MDPISSNLQKLAIDAALEGRFEDAVKLNRRIIKVDPQNVDALNRQARCYVDLGKNNLAKKYYLEVLKFDPYNPIALKNLKILKSAKLKASKLRKKDRSPDGQSKLSPELFLEEPGKTKVVALRKVAEPKVLSQIYCGRQVNMLVKNKKIIITDDDGGYLGVLPDDICHHLIRLVKGGNKYNLIIKSIKVNGLSVLIRETYRSKRFKNQASFLEGNQYQMSDVLTPIDAPNEDRDAEEEEA